MNLYQRLLEIERRQTQIERYRAELGASILTASQNQFNMDSGTIASLANGDNGLVAPYDLVSSCEVRFVSTRVFTNYNSTPTGSTFLWNGEGAGYIYTTDNSAWINMATLQSNNLLPYLFEWTALSYVGVQTQSGITSYRFSVAGINRNSDLYLKRNNDNSIRYLEANKVSYNSIDGTIGAGSSANYGLDTPLKSGTTGTYQFGSLPYDPIGNLTYFRYFNPYPLPYGIDYYGPKISQVGLQTMSLFEVRW